MDQELSSAKAWAWERINLSLHSARVLLDGLGLWLLFWYLHGWIFPTGTCMGGQKLYTAHRGRPTWMGLTSYTAIPWYMDGSLFLQNWYMDGWWVVALQNSQRHTPTQTKVEYPPPPRAETSDQAACSFLDQIDMSFRAVWRDFELACYKVRTSSELEIRKNFFSIRIIQPHLKTHQPVKFCECKTCVQ